MKKLLNKQNFNKYITSTNSVLVLVFFCLLILTSFSQIHSYSIEPAIKEFVLSNNENTTSSINFTNTTDQKQDFKIYTHRYNPKNQEILDERNFIDLQITTLSLEANEAFEFDYSINIPEDILAGTYFSIIVVENVLEVQEERTSSININYGIGALIAMHVTQGKDISEIFKNEVETNLRYKKPLNPFNTEIEYSLKNNSDFTFLTLGQLTIASKGQKPVFYRINEDETKLYPNEELFFNFTYKGGIRDLISNKLALAKVGNQFTSDLKENQIELPYLPQTLTVVIGITLILTIIVFTTVIVKKQGNRKARRVLKEKLTKTKKN